MDRIVFVDNDIEYNDKNDHDDDENNNSIDYITNEDNKNENVYEKIIKIKKRDSLWFHS